MGRRASSRWTTTTSSAPPRSPRQVPSHHWLLYLHMYAHLYRLLSVHLWFPISGVGRAEAVPRGDEHGLQRQVAHALPQDQGEWHGTFLMSHVMGDAQEGSLVQRTTNHRAARRRTSRRWASSASPSTARGEQAAAFALFVLQCIALHCTHSTKDGH